jgi:hypothetical protein
MARDTREKKVSHYRSGRFSHCFLETTTPESGLESFFLFVFCIFTLCSPLSVTVLFDSRLFPPKQRKKTFQSRRLFPPRVRAFRRLFVCRFGSSLWATEIDMKFELNYSCSLMGLCLFLYSARERELTRITRHKTLFTT